MNDFFIWNGVDCRAKGIRVGKHPTRVIPQQREQSTAIPGRTGTLTMLEGEEVYDDIINSCECWIEGEKRLGEIANWLKGSGTVTFGNRQGGYYEARIANQLSFEQVIRGGKRRSFIVNFRCKPYFYFSGVEDITVTGATQFLDNPGNLHAEPVITLTCTGDAEIVVGTTVIQIVGLTGDVTIDTPQLECYQGYNAVNDHMVGEFPRIPASGCYINLQSGVTKAVIKPNWCSL